MKNPGFCPTLPEFQLKLSNGSIFSALLIISDFSFNSLSNHGCFSVFLILCSQFSVAVRTLKKTLNGWKSDTEIHNFVPKVYLMAGEPFKIHLVHWLIVSFIPSFKKKLELIFKRCCTGPRKKIAFCKTNYHNKLPNNTLLQFSTVHYGCYLQDSVRCELYTVSTIVVFHNFSFENHHVKWPSSKTTPHISTVHYGFSEMYNI